MIIWEDIQCAAMQIDLFLLAEEDTSSELNGGIKVMKK